MLKCSCIRLLKRAIIKIIIGEVHMKKVIIISLFVLGLIIPNIDVKAVDVSNEEELRAAIEQGGDITLTDDIEVTQPLVIDKDVTISGGFYAILMQGDNTLMTVNRGNVTLDRVRLWAGWNGKYDDNYPYYKVVKNQGTALVVNGGTVNLGNLEIKAGNIGLEVNGGTVTGRLSILAGGKTENYTYSGGQGMIVNSGNVDLGSPHIVSGGIALTVNNGVNVTLDGAVINSYEGNGIEVNDGSVVNIQSTMENHSSIFGSKNSIYLNGGTANLSGHVGLSSSTNGKGIYINKGINMKTDGDVLNLGRDFVFGYDYGTIPNFSIYVNSGIKELKITDEKGFMELLDNKLYLGFCGGQFELAAQTDEEKRAICSALDANYDGSIYSNELNKCTTVYINGVKQNEPDASCNPVANNENTENNEQGPEIVEVPSTSAYGSIIIAVLGIICVIVSVFVMRRVTKKAN